MAKYYSEEIIDEVRQNNDVVDVISQYVHLSRKGRNYFGLCPFHNEKSPSFSVSPDKQTMRNPAGIKPYGSRFWSPRSETHVQSLNF